MPETTTTRRPLRPLRDGSDLQVIDLGHTGAGFPRALVLSLDELQAIAQAAWDQHGITAQPFVAEPAACNATAHCRAERHADHCPTAPAALTARK